MIEIYSYVASGGDGSYSTRWVKDKNLVEKAAVFYGYGEPEIVSDSYHTYNFPDDFNFDIAGFMFDDENLEEMFEEFSSEDEDE